MTENSLRAILAQGIRHHQQGDLSAAETCYRQILLQAPEFPDALNFLGVLNHQKGMSATGLELIGKAIQLAPDYFDAYANAGRIFMELELYGRAESVYAKAVALQPDHAGAARGLASARGQLQAGLERLETLRLASAEHPEDPETHYRLGLELRRQNLLDEAETVFRRTLELEPQAREAYYQLFRVYYTRNQSEPMQALLKTWLENIPDDPNAQHMLWSITGQHTPKRASDDYVRESFDKFAASFDQVLQGIDYRAPRLIAEWVEQQSLHHGLFAEALDAGCGTGLCGPLIRPHAHRLTGVDLSPKMLDKARARDCYDALIQEELTRFIIEHKAQYDLILSADTLVYFGDLEPVAQAAWGALLAGGRLIFTVEKLENQKSSSYVLNPHGRYQHTSQYVADTLTGAGFDIDFIATAILRYEAGTAVTGLLVNALKPEGKNDASKNG
ncbi:MAG: tetratricopeptide repeat protein [Methylococcaceae bacterium]|nr:tetratricopeptide repeat protein [Methylococcaceae bacterium]